MQLHPYLNFAGRTEEAIEFYKKALGARVERMVRFKDSPQPQPAGMLPPGTENKIMHATLQIGESTLMASDSQCQGDSNFQGFSISLNLTSDAEAERAFAALSDGGKVSMPMSKTFFASKFGMVQDRFGLSWMVMHMA